jgi:hypothetical protein
MSLGVCLLRIIVIVGNYVDGPLFEEGYSESRLLLTRAGSARSVDITDAFLLWNFTILIP